MLGKSQAGYLAWKRQYWQGFLKKAQLEIGKTERLLEVGCGAAGVFLMFPENPVTAVEPLFEKYRRFFSHLQNGSFPNTTFYPVAFEKYHRDEPFDHIFCLNVINHVADLPVCMGKLARLTIPGGNLAMTVDAHNFLFFKRLFRLVPADILHPHQFDLNEYLEKLQGAGFQTERVELLRKGFIFNYYLLIAKRASKALSAL